MQSDRTRSSVRLLLWSVPIVLLAVIAVSAIGLALAWFYPEI